MCVRSSTLKTWIVTVQLFHKTNVFDRITVVPHCLPIPVLGNINTEITRAKAGEILTLKSQGQKQEKY